MEVTVPTDEGRMIPLDISLPSLIRSRNWLWVVVGYLLGWANGLSPTFLLCCTALLLAGLSWKVYSYKGCWIQFGHGEITFFKSGKEHKYDLADLVSVRCLTTMQGRFAGNFVTLKFKSGKVVFAERNRGFAEARDALLQLLTSSKAKDYSVVGDLELPLT